MKKIIIHAEKDASMMSNPDILDTAQRIVGALCSASCEAIVIKDEEENVIAEKYATLSESLAFAIEDFQKKLILYTANSNSGSETDIGAAMAYEEVIDRLRAITSSSER